MADKVFTLPTLKTPAGTMQIKIYYSDATASDTTINDLVYNLNPLHIPFEVIGKNQTFRYANIKISVQNINNAFETNAIYSAAKKAETFIDLYKDGSLYWSGRLVWEKSKKKKWYKDSSGLKYSIYDLYCIDKIEYLNNYTLADASYADDQGLYDITGTIGNLIGLLRVGPSFTDWKLTEWTGREYGIKYGGPNYLKIHGLNSTMILTDFLKQFCLSFGLTMHNLNGKLYFYPRNKGTAVTLADRDILLPAERIQLYNITDYIEITGHIDFATLYGSTGNVNDNYIVTATSGTAGNAANKKMIITDDLMLPGVFIPYDSSDAEYPIPRQLPTSVGGDSIQYSGFETSPHQVESGMKVNFNYVSPLYGDSSVIINEIGGTNIGFYGTGNAASLTKEFQVDRTGSTANRIYKIDKLVKYVRDIYVAFFTDDMYKLNVFGLQDPAALFSWDSKTLKASNVKLDFQKNSTTLTLRSIA